MLTELCKELNNWDFNHRADKYFGTFTISGGSIAPLDFLQDGQFFRIVDSVFNDGVYQYPCYDLIDETFTGAIWAMYVPPEILKLSAEIKEFTENENTKIGPYTSESFGGYSYTKATNSKGVAADWKTVFDERLSRWRKI